MADELRAEDVNEAAPRRRPRSLPGHAQGWLERQAEKLIEARAQVFVELAAEMDELVGSEPAIEVAVAAHTAAWPAEVRGFLVVLARSQGATWQAIGARLGAPAAEVRRSYAEWEAPFERAFGRARGAAAKRAHRPPPAIEPAAGSTAAQRALFGRAPAVAELVVLLGRHRLVTLHGGPGVGKSQLAREVARRVEEGSRSGRVVVVDLASPPDQRVKVDATIAGALSVPAGSILDHLTGDLLLVLDNCDGVVGPCAALVEQMLARCPGMTVLATSRESLRVDGERLWVVEGLAVPDEDVLHSPAVALFLDRAVGLEPSDDAIALAAQVCRRCNGNPLAIEIAASHIGTVALPELVAMLEDPFPVLVDTRRSADPRHRSLRDAFDAGYDLLPPAEQALLRRMAVFAGPVRRSAVESVCSGGAVPSHDVLLLLEHLVAASWVRSDAGGTYALFGLPGLVARYCAGRLAASGERDELMRRHTEWCDELTRRAEPELAGSAQRAWMLRLDDAYGELRAALARSLPGDEAAALRMAGALTLYWRVRGLFGEGLSWLTAALDANADATGTVLARAEWGAGFLSLMVADPVAARRHLEASLGLYRNHDHAVGIGRTLLLLGNLAQVDAEGESADVYLGDSALTARQAGDWWCFCHALALLARTLFDRGEVGEARQLLDQCIEVARRSGDAQSLRIGLYILGNQVLAQGDYDEAETLLQETLALTASLGEVHGEAGALITLGRLALARGDLDRAKTLLEKGVLKAEEGGDPQGVTAGLVALGELSAAMGESSTARTRFSDAATRARRAGMSLGAAALGLARVALADGQTSTASPLLYQVLAGARAQGDKAVEADALVQLAALSGVKGDLRRSARTYRQALTLRHGLGDVAGVLECLERLAGVAVALGSTEHAAQLFGAAETIRRAQGIARTAIAQYEYEESLVRLRTGLPGGEVESAWAHGATMTVHDAVRCATAGRGRSRAMGGWASLTPGERKVAELAAQGLTNKEIAARLYLSRHTVASHLTSVYPKLGVRSRAELTELAAPDT